MALQRSNIMLEEDVKLLLKQVSEDTGKSISNLINEAARKAYLDYAEIAKRKKLHQDILVLREKVRGKVKSHEIKDFINEGRK